MSVNVLSIPANDSVNSIFRPIKVEAEATDTSGATLALARMALRVQVAGIYINNNNPIIQDPDLDQTGATGGSTKFTFDISKILQQYFTHDIQSEGFEGGATTSNSLKEIGLYISGVYRNTSTNVLTESSSADLTGASFTFYGLNAVRDIHDTQNFDDYTLGSGTKSFLTPFAHDQEIYIRTDESYQLSGLYFGSTPDLKIWVNAEKSGGSSEEFYIDVASVGNRFDLGVGCSNFANLVSGDMHSSNSGTLPIIESDVTQYDIILYDGSTQLSGRYRFKINRNCTDYKKRLVWKNRLGGFDAWTFVGANVRGQNQSKTFYRKNTGFNYATDTREVNVLSVDANNVFSAYSGIVTKEVRQIFEELYSSPVVFEVSGTTQIPINILDTEIVTINENANLLQVQVNYQYSYENVINV